MNVEGRCAPLARPQPNWHKYSWLAELLGNMGRYRSTTNCTARLDVAARQRMRYISRTKWIDFDRDEHGILHFYQTSRQMAHARRVSGLLAQVGVQRHELQAESVHALEARLKGEFIGGLHTPPMPRATFTCSPTGWPKPTNAMASAS